jgi:hypothetical protein
LVSSQEVPILSDGLLSIRSLVTSNVMLDKVGARVWIAHVLLRWNAVTVGGGVRVERDAVLRAAFCQGSWKRDPWTAGNDRSALAMGVAIPTKVLQGGLELVVLLRRRKISIRFRRYTLETLLAMNRLDTFGHTTRQVAKRLLQPLKKWASRSIFIRSYSRTARRIRSSRTSCPMWRIKLRQDSRPTYKMSGFVPDRFGVTKVVRRAKAK